MDDFIYDYETLYECLEIAKKYDYQDIVKYIEKRISSYQEEYLNNVYDLNDMEETIRSKVNDNDYIIFMDYSDNTLFFGSCLLENKDEFGKIIYHKIGTPQITIQLYKDILQERMKFLLQPGYPRHIETGEPIIRELLYTPDRLLLDYFRKHLISTQQLQEKDIIDFNKQAIVSAQEFWENDTPESDELYKIIANNLNPIVLHS